MHAAVNMARRKGVATQLPGYLLWPFDCEHRCGDRVRVPTGPAVAHEMTRNLREPFRSQLRAQWEGER
jgi:hypothetical protein